MLKTNLTLVVVVMLALGGLGAGCKADDAGGEKAKPTANATTDDGAGTKADDPAAIKAAVRTEITEDNADAVADELTKELEKELGELE